MSRFLLFITILLACGGAHASVGLLLTPTAPELSQTQVIVFRDGNTATVAARSLEDSQAPRVFPIYPNMKNIRIGQFPMAAFDILNDDTTPTLERWVEADPCGPAPSPLVRPPIAVNPPQESSNEALLTIAGLKKQLGADALNDAQLSALEHETKLGAKFVILKSLEGQVASVTYEADLLELPTRLGQLNQSKRQRLRIFIVSSARFEVSNFWPGFLPTNIEIRPEAKDFSEIHQSVVSRSDEQRGNAFWVEFAGPIMAADEHVVTRMSHSSASGKLEDNLTLSPANPLVGGTSDNKQGAFGGEKNDFRIRYFSNQKFSGSVTCAKPIQERWQRASVEAADAWPTDATPMDLSPVVMTIIPEIYVSPAVETVEAKPAPVENEPPPAAPPKTGCASVESSSLGVFGVLIGLFLMRRKVQL